MSGEIFIPQKEKEHLLSETVSSRTSVLKRQSEFSLQQREPRNRKLKSGVGGDQEATYYEPGGKEGAQTSAVAAVSLETNALFLICPIPLGEGW